MSLRVGRLGLYQGFQDFDGLLRELLFKVDGRRAA